MMKSKSKFKLYTVNGFTGTLSEVAAFLNMNPRTLQSRLSSGWSFERAVSTPVDKVMSVKTPTQLCIAKFKGSADSVYVRFGCKLVSSDRINSEKALARLQRYHKPNFYNIDDYCGTLLAISEDFGCPLSELKNGIENSMTPAEVIKAGGYSLKVKR